MVESPIITLGKRLAKKANKRRSVLSLLVSFSKKESSLFDFNSSFVIVCLSVCFFVRLFHLDMSSQLKTTDVRRERKQAKRKKKNEKGACFSLYPNQMYEFISGTTFLLLLCNTGSKDD